MRHDPCPEEEMRQRVRVDTICATLRRIYRLSTNEEIRVLARIATTMAKKMDAKLTEYRRTWDQGFWEERRKPMSNTITLRLYGRRIRRKAEQYNKPLPLGSYLVPLLPDSNRVRILDIGSGPFSVVGSVHPRKRITVTAADSLAREYSELMARRGIKPLIPIDYQDMEHLTYHDNLFDIVHCVNALDHTAHPDAALREMLRVCRSGGYVHLRHFSNMGDRKRYTGLHRWNIELYNRDSQGRYCIGCDCRIWNKEGEFLLSTILPGAVNAMTRPGTRREMIVSTYRKV